MHTYNKADEHDHGYCFSYYAFVFHRTRILPRTGIISLSIRQIISQRAALTGNDALAKKI